MLTTIIVYKAKQCGNAKTYWHGQSGS